MADRDLPFPKSLPERSWGVWLPKTERWLMPSLPSTRRDDAVFWLTLMRDVRRHEYAGAIVCRRDPEHPERPPALSRDHFDRDARAALDGKP